MEAQTTSQILMVKPVHFNYNLQTATDNAFQNEKEAFTSPVKTQEKALEEFEEMVKKLEENEVDVLVVEDTEEPYTPDSIFPNNWISTHMDGTIVLYPMFAPNRRTERKPFIIESLQENFRVSAILDFSMHEREGFFLEGTGSIVLDRAHRIAYACFSERTHPKVLREFGKRFAYKIISFKAEDVNGKAIYHTNVMMCVGDKFAVLCSESIHRPKERAEVLESLRLYGKEVVEISLAQTEKFAGNMLNVRNKKGESLLLMSSTAYYSLTDSQLKKLEHYAKLLHFPINTVENNGGGSVRCMIAEIFLTKKN